MTTPILVLAFLAVIGGLLNLPFSGLEFLTEWLDPVFEDVPEIHASSFLEGFLLSCLSVAVGLTGIVIAHRFYRRGLRRPERGPVAPAPRPGGPPLRPRLLLRRAHRPRRRRPAHQGADLARPLRRQVIDGAVNGVGRLFREAGGAVRKVQTGLVRNYALGVVIGAVGLLVFMLVRGGM